MLNVKKSYSTQQRHNVEYEKLLIICIRGSIFRSCSHARENTMSH